MKMDIIIPIYNNEKQISNIYNKILEELKDLKYNIIFIDDNSNDKSLELLKSIQKSDEEKIKLLSMSKNFGKDICIYAGLKYSKNDLICIYDIESGVNTSYIKKMYEFIISHNEYDQICMYSNLIQNKKTNLFNKLFNLNIDINKSYTRLIKRNVLVGLMDISKAYKFSKYLFEMIGFNTYYLKYDSKKVEFNENLKKYLSYSKNPFNFIKYINYLLLLVLLILTILSISKVLIISNTVLLILMILLSTIQITTVLFTTNNIIKKECNNCYILKDKIGFDENIL